MAAGRARAAAGDAGDRVLQRRIARNGRKLLRPTPRSKRGGLRRWPQRRDRVPWAEGDNDRLPAMAANWPVAR